jgi:hypothetical protein
MTGTSKSLSSLEAGTSKVSELNMSAKGASLHWEDWGRVLVSRSIGMVIHVGMTRYIFVAMSHIREARCVCISIRYQGRMGYIPSHIRHIHMALQWLSHIPNNLLACWAG